MLTVHLSKIREPKNSFATTAIPIASIDAPWGVDQYTAAVEDLRVYTSGDTRVGIIVYLHIFICIHMYNFCNSATDLRFLGHDTGAAT